jgi:hypothetical protein
MSIPDSERGFFYCKYTVESSTTNKLYPDEVIVGVVVALEFPVVLVTSNAEVPMA